MALLYPVVVPCSVILSLIAVDCFTGPTINTADFNDIGVAQFYQLFRGLLTPITAAAVYQNQLIFIRQLRNVLCADGFVGNINRTWNMLSLYSSAVRTSRMMYSVSSSIIVTAFSMEICR
jgi:hypothetical protein